MSSYEKQFGNLKTDRNLKFKKKIVDRKLKNFKDRDR